MYGMIPESIKDIFWESMTTSKQEEKGKITLSIIILEYSDGPALWVNATLEKGQTNKSATFGNELLNLGEKNKDELFEIHNMELFIL